MVGDAAANTAKQVKPSDEQLSQIDRPAEDNTWHEAPDLSKDNLRSQVQSRVPLQKKEAQEEAKAATGDATRAAHPEGTRDPAQAAQDHQQGTAGVDAKKGGEVGAKNMKNRFADRMDDEQREKMRQYREKTNNYFKEKVPKERRDQTIFRLKKMVVEVQMHKDCKHWMDLISLTVHSY